MASHTRYTGTWVSVPGCKLGLCSDTYPERPGQSEQHTSDTDQLFWTGSVGSTVRGIAYRTVENGGVLHIDMSM
jgi:hypothetical protein